MGCHRGASGDAPENTLPAFRRALELGAFEVELDVQLSRDNVVVLFHDPRLDRKTDGSGAVRLLSKLLDGELSVDGVSIQPPSLNGLFLKLTGRELRD